MRRAAHDQSGHHVPSEGARASRAAGTTERDSEGRGRQGPQLRGDPEVLDPDSVRARYVAPLVNARRHKGLTELVAQRRLKDNVVLGTRMLARGDVDGSVSEGVHATANAVRPAVLGPISSEVLGLRSAGEVIQDDGVARVVFIVAGRTWTGMVAP